MAHTNVLERIDTELVERILSFATIQISLENVVDKEEEKKKLLAEIEKLESEIKRASSMLSNEKFISKAPAAKVEEEKEKLAKFEAQLKLVLEKLGK